EYTGTEELICASRSILNIYLFLFCLLCGFFFFFQAEDGIRDKLVTGVQTCALPIFCCGRSTARTNVWYFQRPRTSTCATRLRNKPASPSYWHAHWKACPLIIERSWNSPTTSVTRAVRLPPSWTAQLIP